MLSGWTSATASGFTRYTGMHPHDLIEDELMDAMYEFDEEEEDE